MTSLGEIKVKRALRVLRKLGFEEKRRAGSHRMLVHSDGRVLLFAFHDNDTIGPVMLKKLLKDAGLESEAFRAKA